VTRHIITRPVADPIASKLDVHSSSRQSDQAQHDEKGENDDRFAMIEEVECFVIDFVKEYVEYNKLIPRLLRIHSKGHGRCIEKRAFIKECVANWDERGSRSNKFFKFGMVGSDLLVFVFDVELSDVVASAVVMASVVVSRIVGLLVLMSLFAMVPVT
jgi:hypothetical protein